MRSVIVALTMSISTVAIAAPAVAQTASTPAEYVRMAGASDQYEIRSSDLVMKSTNPAIRQFAQQMVTDHTKSTADVKAAAKTDKVATPASKPMPDAKQMSDLAALKRVSGTARDSLYVQQQKMAHQQALALHQGYAQSGSGALQSVAGQIAPVVQSHLDMLNQMPGGAM